ncbi:S41 family peptidase [Chromobacterium sp. IIBBL 290-4]|uniref:S41 family peptidase n=1 Tax=Chromobacterium sp. IIBBL 290-4 TaxID=2953890 RepID=UPI0020B8CBA8|nr:S41 family peptidase [Chromobacterium sp. IIBBL 290-4]UTH73400.1 S41 family peptidase [Chromobacterium sp. IIBBL 290-4]
MRRHSFLFPAALCLLAAANCQAAAATSFDAKAWQHDFQLLKQELEKRYSHLAWMASPQSGVDLPALNQKAQAALAAARDDGEARRAILDFQSGFHDGHFSLLKAAPPAPAAAAASEPPKRDPALDSPLDGCAAQGYVQSSRINFSLPFETLPGVRLLSDGLSQSMRSAIIDLGPKGKLGLLRIASFSPHDYPLACQRAWSAVSARVGHFDPDQLFGETMKQWYAETAQRMRDLKAAGAQALIIDVGDNPGGNDSGNSMARLLGAKPGKAAPLWMTRSQAAENYLKGWEEDLSSGLPPDTTPQDKTILQPFLLQVRSLHTDLKQHPRTGMDWAWREQRAFKPEAPYSGLMQTGYASGLLAELEAGRYSQAVAENLFWPALAFQSQAAWPGPAYVLTDGKSYSSAEMFAATIQDNRLAKIIGAKTGGDGCGFMGTNLPLTLPHSGLRFRIPNCVRLRKDGSDEVAGIQPDIALPDMPGASPRAKAQKVLDMIERDLAQPGGQTS